MNRHQGIKESQLRADELAAARQRYFEALADPELSDANRIAAAVGWTRAELDSLGNGRLRDRLVALRGVFEQFFGRLS